MALKKYSPRVPSEYQEIEYISSNDGNGRYINTGLLGSDLTDCEIEAVMKNDTTDTSYYNLNGAYLQGSSAQFGTVATSSTKCRVSINFAFSSAISVTDLALSQFHKIYISNGLQKVNDDVVGNNSFGTLVNYPFLLFARSNDNQGGYTSCFAMSLKSFIVKRDGIYIRNYVPVRRKSDNKLGLYDIVNNTFASSATAYEFTGGNDVDNWHDIPCHKYETKSETIQSGDTIYANGQPITTYMLKGNEEHTGTPSPQNPVMPNGVGNKTANLLDLASWTNQNTDTRSYFQIVVLFMNDNTQLGKTSNIDVRTTGEKTIAINITEANCNRMQIKHNGSSRDLFIGNAYGEFYGEYTLSFNCISNDPTTVGGIELQNIMLNSGTTALPYEPYGQYKIPISSAGQTIDIYIGDLPLLKSLDGTAVDEISNDTLTRRVDSDGSVLPTPTTTQITMPSIPTTDGANSITVDTTVQPSEFTATWTGWHDSSVKEYDGSDWQ